MALTIENISHSGGIVERARKGTNAAHYMKAAPVMLGSFDVETACGKTLGSSRDCEIEMGISVPGALCKRCEKIYSAMLDAQTVADVATMAPGPARDAVARTLPVAEMAPGTARDNAVRELWTGGSDPDPVATRKAAVARERKRLTDQRARRKAERDARDARESAPVPAVPVATEIDPVMGRIAAVESPGTDGIAEIDARRAEIRERRTARKARESKPLDVKAVRAAVVAHALENGTPDGVTITDSDCDAYVAETLPGTEIIASTGKTMAQMIAETAAYYANGGKTPPEIEKLRAGITGTIDLTVLRCEFKGGVEIINPEKTHGKCPGCSAYIPLLPEKESRESGPKVSKDACGSVGESPKPGTRVMRDNHSVSVPDDYDGKHSGKCPGCDRVIAVSREGGMRRHNGVTNPGAACGSVDEIGTHNVGGIATPAHKGLTSRAIDTVEHGSIPGDTATADKRRGEESRCKGSRKTAHNAKPGSASCPVCTRVVELRERKGPKKTTYSFPDHVSALPSVKHVGRGEVRDVTPRGEGADVGATVTPGARLALSRGHGTVDGSATTGSQDMAPVQPKGWLGIAGTGQLPATVRPGIDPEVSGKWCPVCEGAVDIKHKDKTSSWKRRHAAKLRAHYDQRDAVREAERAAKIASGEIIPAAERKAMRKAASIGSFSEGTVSGTVTHEPRPEFTPKAERKTAPRVAGPKTREAARKAVRSAARKSGK